MPSDKCYTEKFFKQILVYLISRTVMMAAEWGRGILISVFLDQLEYSFSSFPEMSEKEKIWALLVFFFWFEGRRANMCWPRMIHPTRDSAVPASGIGAGTRPSCEGQKSSARSGVPSGGHSSPGPHAATQPGLSTSMSRLSRSNWRNHWKIVKLWSKLI